MINGSWLMDVNGEYGRLIVISDTRIRKLGIEWIEALEERWDYMGLKWA